MYIYIYKPLGEGEREEAEERGQQPDGSQAAGGDVLHHIVALCVYLFLLFERSAVASLIVRSCLGFRGQKRKRTSCIILYNSIA